MPDQPCRQTTPSPEAQRIAAAIREYAMTLPWADRWPAFDAARIAETGRPVAPPARETTPDVSATAKGMP